MKAFILRLPGTPLPLWVTVDLSSLVVKQVAPSKAALPSCDLHANSVWKELQAHGSAMCMHHLSVALSVKFADVDTTQKVHYQADIKNRSDY